jgi:tRNA(Ile)-lysidine synthase
MRRSAELVGEASDLLDQLADIDLRQCGPLEALSIPAITALSPPRQRNLLRRAARLNGLPPPPSTRLHQVINELMPAREDAQPVVRWSGAEVRRYRDRLYFLPDLQAMPGSPGEKLLPSGDPVSLGPGLGSLSLVESARGLDPAIASQGLDIRFRAGGEGIRISEEGPTRKLKKLMQETGVLPWMRDRLPILMSGNDVVAVGDLWVSAEHAATGGFAVEWRQKPAIREPAAL